MADAEKYYDVGIVGGGLAGLALSIQTAKAGYSTVLFEKEVYPFHKVCGEYISLESKEFLISLGVPLAKLSLPLIDKLSLSSPDGTLLQQKLPLGGFGVSRYTIDNMMVDIARAAGVDVYEGTKVQDIIYNGNGSEIVTDKFNVSCKVCCGSFGKRSNIDIKWKREFIRRKPSSLNNYIGVKYHAVLDHSVDTIALHIFKDGYCGFSPVEDGKTCICYLTTARNLKNNANSISNMEENILFKNSHIKNAFSKSVILYEQPLTISQISFDKKQQVKNHVLLIGDAAGMITPLCGNGMSMALTGSKIAAELISSFLNNTIDRGGMESMYEHRWRVQFSTRLSAGRLIQAAFGRNWTANALVKTLRYFPAIASTIIRQTHG